MNEYLLSVIGTVLLSAVLTAIMPEGKTASVIKGIARLACLLAIIAPILNFFQKGELEFAGENFSDKFFSESVIQTDEAFIKYYSEIRIEETENALEKEIHDKYAISTSVSITWENVLKEFDNKYTDKEIKITAIHVKLKSQAEEEVKSDMWEYLTKNYCSEVLIE